MTSLQTKDNPLCSMLYICWWFLQKVCAGFTELSLVFAVVVTVLQVARGLATGAVDISAPSPVHRQVNWCVRPWEKVLKGGNRFPSRMVSHVALFLLTGNSSISNLKAAVHHHSQWSHKAFKCLQKSLRNKHQIWRMKDPTEEQMACGHGQDHLQEWQMQQGLPHLYQR